ncbi:MAG TPA: type IV toxin-antitoxin system AbiEi family antitoxin domain-containing protein [Propionibacteriaceae bacterium]|nr:type IV toxin-antitoxin system AbiEi family antitoxin domain-containing protein [Propionibacteriaceae bacterium]
MTPVRLTRDLLAAGYTHNELARLAHTGELEHVRRGVYATPIEDANLAARHLRLIEATVRLTAADSVVSHLSAAVLHGLPVATPRLGPVQLTRPAIRGGKRRSGVHAHVAALSEEDVTVVRGIPTTSLARTVADLGRSQPFRFAVMGGDAAMRTGLTPESLDRCLLRAKGWPRVAAARRMAAFLDPLSESPGESLSRVALHETAVPAPALQYEIWDQARLVARVDFCWEQQGTIGEFDGRAKYGRLLRPGQGAEDAVYREKRREDALRDLGWQVVRWVWADLETPEVIADRVSRAFIRARR